MTLDALTALARRLLSPPIDEILLPRQHAPSLLLRVVPPAGKMQKTVSDEKRDLLLWRVVPGRTLRRRVIDRDGQLTAPSLSSGFVGGKGHDVGRGVDSHEVPVEGLQARVVDEGDRDLPDPGRPFRGEDERRQRL